MKVREEVFDSKGRFLFYIEFWRLYRYWEILILISRVFFIVEFLFFEIEFFVVYVDVKNDVIIFTFVFFIVLELEEGFVSMRFIEYFL